MTRAPRPDFIIIGAMKCATSTLHVQLAAQPGFHMSTPKEPNFFSDDAQYARGLDWYRGLFTEAPADALRGESSTHYTKRPTYPRTLERLREELDGAPLKLIYLMRHPVERLVSHYIHEWSQGVISSGIDQALDAHPEMVEYGCYASQLEPWIEAFGREAVLPLFFEGLKAYPQRTLERACAFLGHEGEPRWVEEQAAQNVSAQRMRKSPTRDRIAAFPPLKWLRRTFVPESLRERIKSRWTMTERPELGVDARAAVEDRFDRDLARLGSWLGMELDCANWREVTKDAEPAWATD